MAIKRLSKDKLELVENQRLAWLKWHNELIKAPKHSDRWFVLLRERNACYDIIMSVTGLTRSRVDDLVFNKTTVAAFWSPTGEIKRNHPHE